MAATVIVFPGSNCDRDMKVALEAVTGRRVIMTWHQETTLPETDLIVVPGGFSYGDYLRCGAIAVHSPIMKDVVAKAKQGVPVLGICNGFQVLCEAQLLPGVLMRNASQLFVCRDVWLKVERTDTVFTSQYSEGEVVRTPIAHHDGNYFTDADTLERLEDDRCVAFRYVDETGARTSQANPNGSQHNIAGICSPDGRILGMMPHPERLFEAPLGGTGGRPLFESIAEGLMQ